MKIIDRTPFLNDGGKIDIFGRAWGTLKFGMSWYARVQAQNGVIAVLDKTLGPNYVLLRNTTLLDTEIDLPLVLIGPPGIFLINVTHEHGVFQARDDEWGTVSGEKFVPAGINQIQRTVKLGRVLQIYLDRAGFKGEAIVEPILMAADPGMHIESVRPAARIVMSDALEGFAVSMNQGRPVFDIGRIADIARVILNGPRKKAPTVPASSEPLPTPLPEATAEQSRLAEQDDSIPEFSPDALGFSFNSLEDGQPNETRASTAAQVPGEETVPAAAENLIETGEKNTSSISNKTRLLGMTRGQLLILGGLLLFWLCSIIFFAIYIFTNLNA